MKIFQLLEKISTKWKDIGTLIGLLPSKLEVISKQNGPDSVECCRAVLNLWVENHTERYSFTWDGLIELLEDIGMTTAASDLQTIILSKEII